MESYMLQRISELQARVTELESRYANIRERHDAVVGQLDNQQGALADMQKQMQKQVQRLEERVMGVAHHNDIYREPSLETRIHSLETFTTNGYIPSWEHDAGLHPTIMDIAARLRHLEEAVPGDRTRYTHDREGNRIG